MEVGTMKELNVKPGDVVECVTEEEGCFTVGNLYFCNGEGRIEDDHGDEWPLKYGGLYPYATFRIISRTTPTPAIDLTVITTPFGLLDKATQDALLAHGGPYEYYYGGKWYPTDTVEEEDYHWAHRVKPAPKRETVTMDVYLDVTGCIYHSEIGPPVRVTFDRVDGKIDLSTYKVEPRA